MNIIEHIENKHVDVVQEVLRSDVTSSSVIYVNPYNYLFLRKRQDLLENITAVYFDGILMTYLANFFLKKNVKRQSPDMTYLAPFIFQHGVENKKKLYIAGGQEKEIGKFINKIRKYYPRLNVVGYCNGYIDEDIIKNKIKEAEPDIVLLGLGNLKQERVACKLIQAWPALYFTCGAFITQLANSDGERYYPKWINKFNLRWLYRFTKEKQILPRVLRYYPKFIITFFRDLINFKMKRKYIES